MLIIIITSLSSHSCHHPVVNRLSSTCHHKFVINLSSPVCQHPVITSLSSPSHHQVVINLSSPVCHHLVIISLSSPCITNLVSEQDEWLVWLVERNSRGSGPWPGIVVSLVSGQKEWPQWWPTLEGRTFCWLDGFVFVIPRISCGVFAYIKCANTF